MAISDKINSIKQHVGNAYTAIQGKNGTIPAKKNIQNLASAVESIDMSKPEETKRVALNMASGNQSVVPAAGKVLTEVIVEKPATMLPENIKKDVNIGGVTGTLETQKEEEAGTATITENGSQTFSPTVGKVFSNFTVTTNVPTGVDTSDATAVASDILSGKTAYAKGVKLTGSVGTYDGTFVVKVGYWKASVSNLGAQDPSTVVFNTPADSVPKPWSEVEFNGDVFIKFPKMYKKIVTVTDNQITAFEIANAKLDDDYKLYPCFIDESGNELNYILVGKYVSKSSTTCNSVASGSKVEITSGNARTFARARGTGYQLMDWRIHKLWQDLLICTMKTINTNSGSGITTDVLGLEWAWDFSFIDGFVIGTDDKWVYSNSPSKYIDNPDASSDSYSIIYGYVAARANSDNYTVKKLGYDASQPFFNYPSDTFFKYGSYDSYYCDQLYTPKIKNPIVFSIIRPQAYDGAFQLNSNRDWTTKFIQRLCYRPIS